MTTKQVFPSQMTCESCERNYECGVLASALVILETQAAKTVGSAKKEDYDKFIDKLNGHGFSFPASTVFCQLQHDKKSLRNLIYEAVNLSAVLLAASSHRPDMANIPDARVEQQGLY